MPMESLQRGDPASVGGYQLLGRLGAGGMGQVFLGVSPSGRRVAVKVIHPVHAGTEHFRERFAREIEAARRVGGFHTAPVVDADPHAETPWMVTAYIDGPSLQDDVAFHGPLPPGRICALGAGLAEGLAAIHAHGLIHRDLKPGNVIMAEDGPRIIDFGIARSVGATTLTSAGSVVGTFAYMSPEQVRGDPVRPASDVFSLGSVLAFAATGRPPFGSDTAATVMFRIVSQPPDLAGLTDQEFRAVIEACLAKSPENRPQLPVVLTALTGRGPVPVPVAPRTVPAADGRSSEGWPYSPLGAGHLAA
jgi:serine/threonine protein kinase